MDTSRKKSKRCYFVTGGGTGGHIYPALAVAKELRLDDKVFYLGKKNSLEQKIALENEFSFLSYDCLGMPRKIDLSFFKWLLKLQLSTLKCVYYCKKYKPDAIFATGGYVSAPVLLAAQMTHTPYVLHDCDAMPGIVSRYCSKSAISVSLAFKEAKKYINNKNIHINGNPLRKEFSYLTQDIARQKMNLENKFTLMIMGGSQGAKSINDLIIPILENLLSFDIQIIFQTGKKNYDEVILQLKEKFNNYNKYKNLILAPYFDEIAYPLKSANLVISRAGSLSISEICSCSLGSILIPYPHAAANHQLKNALALQELGACICLEEKDLTSDILKEKIIALKTAKEKLEKMQKAAFSNAKIYALDNIITQIRSMFNE